MPFKVNEVQSTLNDAILENEVAVKLTEHNIIFILKQILMLLNVLHSIYTTLAYSKHGIV